MWLSRYQALIVGVVALTLAGLQVWIAFQNMAIQKELHRSKMIQDEAKRALAQVKVNALVRETFALNDKIISQALVRTQTRKSNGDPWFSWRPNILLVLRGLDLIPARDNIDDAITAYPARAVDLVELQRACSDLVVLAGDVRSAEPPQGDALEEWAPVPLDLQPLMMRVDDVLNRLFTYAHRCKDLIPTP